MSIFALGHVFKSDVGSSSLKFVMVCMANYADEQGRCYPSIERLCRDTSANRKTVIKALDALIELGLLRDTGHRVGATRRVIVYEICGLPTQEKCHYTYRTCNPETGEFYIGKRSFAGDPEADVYRGSGRWVQECRAAGIPLVREVLQIFSSDEEASAEEMRLQRQEQHDHLCRNEGTPLRNQERNLIVPKTEPSQKRTETVPNLDGNGPNFGRKQSQKRYSDPSVDPSLNPQRTEEGTPPSILGSTIGMPAGANPEALGRWEQWLRLKGKPVNDLSRPAIARRLVSFGDAERQAVVVEHSIAGQYLQLYPPKPELVHSSGLTGVPRARPKTADEYEEEYRRAQ